VLVVGGEARVIGRNEACDLVIDDETVAFVHLEIVATERGVRVRDLGTERGSFIGTTRLGEVYLSEPTLITIGGAQLEYRPDAPARVDAKSTRAPTAFLGGDEGAWRIVSMRAVRGAPLAHASRLAMIDEPAALVAPPIWGLRGVRSNVRYVTDAEKTALDDASPPLGRPEATRAALIPIRKSDGWWALAQDDRRAIFEERSHHVAASMRFLPAVARRLHHSRDLGEPFDFLTWFEFAPEHEGFFDELVTLLRATEEWKFVEREVDIRLARD
jgi:hypothetical protein